MKGGLRLRLAARAGLLSAAALAGLGLLVEVVVVRPMEEREDARLVSQAEGLAAVVAAEGTAAFRRNAAHWVRSSREEWVVLLAADGRLLASEGLAPPASAALRPGAAPETVEGLSPGGDRAVLREARPPGGEPLRLAAGFPLRGIRAEQLRLRLLLLAGGLLGVALVGAGAWAGAASVLSPLGRMTAAARRSPEDPASLRLPDGGDSGEFDELARLLNDLLSRIEGDMEEERAFAGEAAHELRGPLSLLRMRAERALASGDPASMREALEGSVEDCDRVGRLVQGLLELSRAPRGRAAAGEGAPADAAALLRELAPDLASLGGTRGVGLDLRPPAGPLPTTAPREVVETCLSVLADNAFRYAPPGSRVALSAGPREGGGVRVLVEDGGPGVGTEEAGRVFDRFFRGSAGRAAEGRGFGLGLALARRLARSAGGEVLLLNPGEAGARFALDLPAPAPAG